MNKELQLKRSGSSALDFAIGRLIRFILFSGSSKAGWMAGIRIIFRPKESSKIKEQKKTPRKFISPHHIHTLATHGKIDLAYRMIQCIESNPITFGSSNPWMITLKNSTDKLYEAYVDYSQGGRTPYYRSVMKIKEKEFMAVFKAMFRYLEMISEGNEELVRIAEIIRR